MQRIRFPKKRVLIIDELATVVAFFLTILLRYQQSFFIWNDIYDGLYVSLLIVQCLLQALIFFVYDARRKPIFLQDPAENMVSVIKGKFMLLVGSLLYLYLTQKGELSSRFVMASLFGLGVIWGFVFRMLLRSDYLRKHNLSGDSKTLEVSYPYPDRTELLSLFETGSYDEALIHPAEKGVDEICKLCEDIGFRVYLGTTAGNYPVRSGIISDVNGYAAIPASVREGRFGLFGVDYSVARIEEAAHHVLTHLRELSGEYICFSNVHTSVMARESKEYRDILNNAAFVFADGKPIAMLQQKGGIVGAERVAGPDFMEHMFRDTQDGKLSHYFYGSSQVTLDALKDGLLKKYPGIEIKGMYSPPYRELSENEDKADIEKINASGADIVWIGLGAPKQEKWMNAHKGQISGVMMGVGAGFDFHAGTIKRAPGWVQKVGFEWLYRLFQDPGRLFKRYFVTNTKFAWYLFIDMIKGKNR